MKYIENKNIGSITCKARDGNGNVVFSKTFPPSHLDAYGNQDETGFIEVSDKELDMLIRTSKTFKFYFERQKLLVLHEGLPSELKSPSQALADTSKELAESNNKLSLAEKEIAELKAQLAKATASSKEKAAKASK